MRTQPSGRKIIETVCAIDIGIHVDHLEGLGVYSFEEWDILINLPLFGYCIVLGANEELHRPDNESEEDIHPPPPY